MPPNVHHSPFPTKVNAVDKCTYARTLKLISPTILFDNFVLFYFSFIDLCNNNERMQNVTRINELPGEC